MISSSTKNKFVEVTLNQSKSSTSTDTENRTRTTSEISKHSRFWSLNWAIDKSLFKKAVKRFESCFSKLISNKEISENLSIIKQSRHISMSEQNSFSFNIENSNEFFSVQLIDLIRLISQILDSRQFSINTNVNLEFHSSQSSDDVFDHRQFKDWSAEKIEFFDSVAKETDSIVNVEKHVLYKNVYAFTDRLKNMTIIKKNSKLKLIIFQYLRESTLIWHSIELFTLKKEMLRDASLINWYNALIRRFKKRTSCDGNRNTGAKNSIDRSSIRWSVESGLSTPYISTSVPIIHVIPWSGQIRPWAGMIYLSPIDMIKLSKKWMSLLTFCLFFHCSSLYHTRFLTTLLVNWMTTMFDERLLQIHVNVAIELS